MDSELTTLEAGMPVPYGGNRVTRVPPEIAEAFESGDHLVVVQDTGDILHIPASEWAIAQQGVDRALNAFQGMASVSDDAISDFYEHFARRLADDDAFAPIAAANDEDVEQASARGRSTTRLVLSEKMRADMISGLRTWRDTASVRGEVVETISHPGWRVEQVRAGLGVIGFVFEGRPNVFADATGVLRAGNTVVFRIGSDALGTARAILEHALDPALEAAGLPEGAVALLDSPTHAVGYALFSDSRLSLAVARGSGPAVAQLGAVARQSGIAVSLHGTGGAWIVASAQADPEAFAQAVYHSLDRKVCNTLNTCCIVAEAADELVPRFLDALARAARRRDVNPKLHVTDDARDLVADEWFEQAAISRTEGEVVEPMTEAIGEDQLGHEWEWEDSPEVTLTLVGSVAEAVETFNRQSPHFIASLVSEDDAEHRRFYETVDAPFVGNGFTRWVDGQYALNRPELGLSNWQYGRLFARGAVLSGDSTYTIRSRAVQDDPDIGR